jgi:hypothetical protein
MVDCKVTKTSDGSDVICRLGTTDLKLNNVLAQDYLKERNQREQAAATNPVNQALLKLGLMPRPEGSERPPNPGTLIPRSEANRMFTDLAAEYRRTGNANLSNYQVGGSFRVQSDLNDQLNGKWSETVYWAGPKLGLQERDSFNKLIRDGSIADSNGKIYCGKDWGFQSKETHRELKERGKLDLV